MSDAVEFILSEPWLITEEWLRKILSIAERTHDPTALARMDGSRLSGSRRVQMRERTAVIPVVGPIFRYANLFADISGATSTEVLAKDFSMALDDPLVRSIVLDINSPGGTATGINELADMIYAGREVKPIVAYGGGQVASAAYWIASATEALVIDRTSMVGSIGAKISFTDASEREKRAGVRTVEIVSSQSPDKVLDHNNDEGRAKIQKIVDDLAAVFIEAVARNRDVTVETVLADYGRGGMLLGTSAIEAGLADRNGSLESVLAELAARDRDPQRRSFYMAGNTNRATPRGPITVTTTDQLHAALAAGHAPEEITITSVDVAAIKAEGHAAGVAEQTLKMDAAVAKATADATAAERARVSGLQAISMKGFEKEIGVAIDNGATVEATAVAIAKLARERGTTVAAIAGDAPGAVRHSEGGAGAGADAKGWGKITAKVNERTKRRAG